MLNVAILTGRLTKTPELKHTPSGVPVTRFSVAVQRNYKSSSGEYEADFINIVAWRNHAEFITRYFTKGQEIGIEGSIQTRKHTDKEGNNRTAFEVIVNRVFFIGGEKESAHVSVTDDITENDEGDLPF